MRSSDSFAFRECANGGGGQLEEDRLVLGEEAEVAVSRRFHQAEAESLAALTSSIKPSRYVGEDSSPVLSDTANAKAQPTTGSRGPRTAAKQRRAWIDPTSWVENNLRG
jgi:hypothetical protein